MDLDDLSPDLDDFAPDLDDYEEVSHSLNAPMYEPEPSISLHEPSEHDDILQLNILCARTKLPKDTEESLMEAEESWQAVREWLQQHNDEQVIIAAEEQGESGLTALHFACRHAPPVDIIELLLSLAPNTSRVADNFGWLPIHYACASGSSPQVIRALTDAFPESKTATDSSGRTPLHFALGEKPAPPAIVHLLSSSGAASYKDHIGMLPLHYACAFGATEEVIYVLVDAYPDAIRAGDSRKRTPLHFALSNAGRKAVPSAVRLLLNLDPSIVNSVDGGPLPLKVLADYAVHRTVRSEYEGDPESRECVDRCLEYLFQADPDPTPDFFTALQTLPMWLREKAVVLPTVQNLLNEKIAQRFPTAVLMMDFIVLVLVIIFYAFSVTESIKGRFQVGPDGELDKEAGKVDIGYVMPLFIGAFYFLLREVVQIIALISLKAFKLWLHDPSNYFNIVYISLITTWAVIMLNGEGDRDNFRVGAAISVIVLWVKLLQYLRNMVIDFAVFMGGVFYVVRRLAAFLMALGLILIAFSQMFYTVFKQTTDCGYGMIDTGAGRLLYEMDSRFLQDVAGGFSEIEEAQCDITHHPFCDMWESFLHVYTMLLGEVDETLFENSGVAIALFVLFMFLVVILLANVLIAIVTDSYKVIQDQRAAVVFWTNRLDFVAEMDAIGNLRQYLGCKPDKNAVQQAEFGRETWKQLMDMFEEDPFDSPWSLDAIAHSILQLITALILIPGWIVLGALTFGIFWPPQLREAVFTSSVFAHATDAEKDEALRKTQVKKLAEEVKDLREELMQELVLDRTQVVQMKSLVAVRKNEIASEMRDIKRIVALLFERQATFGADAFGDLDEGD